MTSVSSSFPMLSSESSTNSFDLAFCDFFIALLVFGATLFNLPAGFAFDDAARDAFGAGCTSLISILESDDGGLWRLGRLSVSDSSSTTCTSLRFEGSEAIFFGWR